MTVVTPKGVVGRVRSSVDAFLARGDLAICRRSYLERLRAGGGPSFTRAPLPPGADEALRPDHPRLGELISRYRGHPAASSSLWDEAYLDRELDLRHFRGDNVYVWQQRGHVCHASYALTTRYVAADDRLGLLERLTEDPLFGVHTYEVGGRLVSRDLLDSVVELNFLERHLGLSAIKDATILDIGAGYGRLGHRATTAFDDVTYLCTDAVAASTFLSEFYLGFRGARAQVVPLDEIEKVVGSHRVDLAVNVHSFVEAPLEAVTWWIDLLAAAGVRFLAVVATDATLVSRERSGERLPLRPLLESRGYALTAQEEKYQGDRDVQLLGVYPSHHFLFRRTGA